jgi:choline kinase
LELQLAREEAALVSIQHDNDAKRIANQAAEHDSDAKKIANQAAEHENEARRLANAMTKRDYVSDVAEKYRDLCGDTVMDERARLMLKDNFLNMAAHEGGKALIADGSSQPISLSLVADEMKVKLSSGELISLGQEVRRRYVEAHGKPPSKHEQLCGGRVTLVNSYFAADKPMIEAVLRAHVEGSA